MYIWEEQARVMRYVGLAGLYSTAIAPCTSPLYRGALCTIVGYKYTSTMYHCTIQHRRPLPCTTIGHPTMWHPSDKECRTRNSREYKLLLPTFILKRLQLKIQSILLLVKRMTIIKEYTISSQYKYKYERKSNLAKSEYKLIQQKLL